MDDEIRQEAHNALGFALITQLFCQLPHRCCPIPIQSLQNCILAVELERRKVSLRCPKKGDPTNITNITNITITILQEDYKITADSGQICFNHLPGLSGALKIVPNIMAPVVKISILKRFNP